MSTERVTVSVPEDVRRAAQQLAQDRGLSFSTVVAEALTGLMRGLLVDAWLAEYEAVHGAFTEDELARLAAEGGVTHLPPGCLAHGVG